jgi:hypothetical protein
MLLRNWLTNGIAILSVVGIGLVVNAAPTGPSIAINFGADEPSGAGLAFVEGAAGVLGTVNWNNFEGPESFAPEPLEMDVSGASQASTAEVEWVSTNTWASDGRGEANNFAPEGDDRALMVGYLDQNTTDFTIEVTVSNLDPVFVGSGYDVYVYAVGGVTGRGGEYTIGNETIEHTVVEPFDGEFIEWDDQDQVGNYMVFRGLTDAAFTLEALNTIGGTPRAPINGIEIVALGGGDPVLQAGDADQDFKFDQLDLVKVQVAAKYLTGNAATWGEGDWNGAPGGSVGNPPAGNGFFDQLDIIAALNADIYLKGPYAAIQPGGSTGDGQTSVVYDANTGEVRVDAPANTELTSINIDSAAGIFTGDPAQNLGGSFDNDANNNIFKATFGSSFGSLTFGNVAQPGLSEAMVLNDLTVIGSLAGGGDLGAVDLIYVPEPSAVALLALGGAAAWLSLGRRRRRD